MPRWDLATAETAPWSFLSLYLGLKDSLSTMGFTGANIWFFPGYEYEATEPSLPEDGDPPLRFLFLSFPSLKDPTATTHTMEIVMPIRYDRFDAWRETTWKRRGTDYEHLKTQLAERMLEAVEARYPGLRALVAYQEVATPLTVEEFTGNAKGAVYAMPQTPHRLGARIGAANTPVKGLLLTGADACMPGIEGAMTGGVLAVAATMGPMGFPTLMRRAAQEAHTRAEPALTTLEPPVKGKLAI